MSLCAYKCRGMVLKILKSFFLSSVSINNFFLKNPGNIKELFEFHTDTTFLQGSCFSKKNELEKGKQKHAENIWCCSLTNKGHTVHFSISGLNGPWGLYGLDKLGRTELIL